MELHITSTIKYTYPSSHYAKPHSHPCYEIIVYFSGTGTTTIDGTEHRFSPHTVAFIPPHVMHDETYDNCGGELICIYFVGDRIPFDPGQHLIFVPEVGTVQQNAMQLYKEIRSQPLGYREKALHLLNILLIDLARSTTEKSQDRNRLESVYHFICFNYANRLNFRALAAESGFSYDYFRRLFRQTYGISPQKLLIEQRFTAARVLLEQENLTVTEIAMRCGFADGSQFTHMFRQKYGFPPRNFRRAAIEVASHRE